MSLLLILLLAVLPIVMLRLAVALDVTATLLIETSTDPDMTSMQKTEIIDKLCDLKTNIKTVASLHAWSYDNLKRVALK